MRQEGFSNKNYCSSGVILPGHDDSSHDLVLCKSPTQANPPPDGAGSVQVLERDWTPFPHVTSHFDHAIQLAQEPSSVFI
jgi:hypothetical protein